MATKTISPVRKAVSPLLEDAIQNAENKTKGIIERIMKGLEECGWDLDKYAPYPNSFRDDRTTYVQKRAKHDFVTGLTGEDKEKYPSGRSRLSEPDFRVRCPAREEAIIEQSKKMAAEQYDLFIGKLETKIGAHTDAVLEGNHVWGYSFLTATKEDGTQEIWKTSMIVNISKLGKVFNQFPTRKVKNEK